ncbi:terminase gpA endonuclease subunit [Thiorhodovibrio winogradskyi]|uniref:terminase gpA endonuclease subunit n=1 Tax=Thiorhodovibrio winogradskyi TaxID=77007 RepID=UPI0031FC827B
MAKVNLFSVGVDAAKEAILARLKKTPPGAGTTHFPLDRDAQYFEQLTAERKRTRYVNGFAQQFWSKPDNRRNEALDCRVYAYAGLYGLIAMGLALNRRVDALPEKPMSQRRPATGLTNTITPPLKPTPRRRRAIPSPYL